MSARVSVRNRQYNTPKQSFLSRLVDPIDLLSEAIFSVLIILIYAMAFGAIMLDADSPGQIPDSFVHDLIIGAAGAVVAWGIIDGIMYALMSMFERGEHNRLLQQLQDADNEDAAVEIVAEEFDYFLESITHEEMRRLLYQDMQQNLRQARPEPVRLSREDVAGCIGSVLVAVAAVLPSLTPLFLFQSNPALAIRTSIGVSFVVLLLSGVLWGRYTGSNSWTFGLLLVGTAAIMVLIVFLLGG